MLIRLWANRYKFLGSGKSYTIVGSEHNPGVIPLLVKELFSQIEKNKSNPKLNSSYKVEITMIEIYNENIRNLLAINEEKRKEIHEIKEGLEGIYVSGVDKIVVNSYQEIRQIYEKGNQNRTIAATKMNQTSSRAHTIFTIRLTTTEYVLLI